MMTRKELLNYLYTGAMVNRAASTLTYESPRVQYSTYGWQSLAYTKACTRSGYMTIPSNNRVDSYKIEVLKSYDTIIGVAIAPVAYCTLGDTAVILRFGTYSNTSSQHFHKWLKSYMSRMDDNKRVYVGNLYMDRNNILTYCYNEPSIKNKVLPSQAEYAYIEDYATVIDNAFKTIAKVDYNRRSTHE